MLPSESVTAKKSYMLVHVIQTSEALAELFIFLLEDTVVRLNNVEVSWWPPY